jgi:hypothetical protein
VNGNTISRGTIQGDNTMNPYDLKCYEKTYNDPGFWHQTKSNSEADKKRQWSDCRNLTDHFYDELINRGYLVPRK